LVSSDVAIKRESPLTFHYKLLEGSYVSDIVLTSEQVAANFTTKEGILAELQEMSKTLEETIQSSTERKASVDKLIMRLLAQATMDADKENVDDNTEDVVDKDTSDKEDEDTEDNVDI